MRRLALSLAIIIYLIFIPLSIAYPMPGKNKPSRRVPYPLPPPNVLKNLRIKADAKVEVGSFALIYWDWESCQPAPDENYGNSPNSESLSDGQKKILTLRTVIVLEVLGDMVTVVPTMTWFKHTHPPDVIPYYARGYFTVPRKDYGLVLNLDHGRTMHKTNLFRDKKDPFPVIPEKYHALQRLLVEIHDNEGSSKERQPPRVPEERRMTTDAKLEVGLTVQMLWESLEVDYGDFPNPNPLSAYQKTKLQTVIVLEVFDVAATVVPLITWNPKRHPGVTPSHYAKTYFMGPKNDMILNFRRGKVAHKTDLFRMPPEDGETIYPVIQSKADELQGLVATEIYCKVGLLEETQSNPEGWAPNLHCRKKTRRQPRVLKG